MIINIEMVSLGKSKIKIGLLLNQIQSKSMQGYVSNAVRQLLEGVASSADDGSINSGFDDLNGKNSPIQPPIILNSKTFLPMMY